MLRITIAIIIVIFQILRVDGNSKLMTVWAPSGPNFREAPSLNSSKLDVIPFGEAVFVLSKTETKFSIQATGTVDSVKGYNLISNWNEINYKGKIGFVLSGWLSELPRPINNRLLDYMNQLYGDPKFQTNETKKNEVQFSGNNKYLWVNSEGCATVTKYEFENLSLNDGFLICYYFLEIDNSSKLSLSRNPISEDEYLRVFKQSNEQFVFENWFLKIDCTKTKTGIVIQEIGG